MKRFNIIFVSMILSCLPVYNQSKFIGDTLIINVPIDSSLSKIGANVNTISDKRVGEEDVLRITQKNVYSYIPVDYYINTNKPVADYLKDFFDSTGTTQYNFEIDRFEITTRKGLIFPAFTLNALIGVAKYSENNTDTIKGTLIYNEEISSRAEGKKPGQKEKKLLKKWEGHFVSDMEEITNYGFNQNQTLPYNFRASDQVYKTNLMLLSRFMAGRDFWMVEGEVIFAEPEAKNRFRQSGYMVRYRNGEKFESIAFSRRYEHFLFRLNSRVLLDINTNFMIGVNKWKDMWETEHPIWHVFLLDLSVTQYLLYTPFNSAPSFVFGAGLLENVYYVPDGMLKFKPGFGIQLGYRF